MIFGHLSKLPRRGRPVWENETPHPLNLFEERVVQGTLVPIFVEIRHLSELSRMSLNFVIVNLKNHTFSTYFS